MSPFLEISDWSASITVNAPLSKTPILDMDEWTITVSFFNATIFKMFNNCISIDYVFGYVFIKYKFFSFLFDAFNSLFI